MHSRTADLSTCTDDHRGFADDVKELSAQCDLVTRYGAPAADDTYGTTASFAPFAERRSTITYLLSLVAECMSSIAGHCFFLSHDVDTAAGDRAIAPARCN